MMTISDHDLLTITINFFLLIITLKLKILMINEQF